MSRLGYHYSYKKTEMKIIEKRFGHCLPYHTLAEPIRELYEIAVDLVSQAFTQARLIKGNRELPYPIIIGFPEKPTFNAGTCDREGGGSIVAINAAVPYLLFCACYIFSSRVDNRTGLPIVQDGKLLVFDTRLELIGRLPQQPSNASEYEALFDQLCSESRYPTADLVYALFLYSIAIRFIVMHEVLHIVLGHTAYMKKEMGLETFLEFSSNREHNMDPRFLHCLEFLADRHAIRGIARNMVDGNSYYATEAQQQLLQETSVTKHTYLVRGIMTAATVLFHLFPSRDETLYEPILSHPNPYVRSQWLAMELGHELGKECDFKQAILMPLAYTAATLSANFKCPGDWRNATELDRNKEEDNRPYQSDVAYQDVLKMATQWSDYIYKNYGPQFATPTLVI